jgi:Raf kinase inhibitor-like YbhB/YbcL family protein
MGLAGATALNGGIMRASAIKGSRVAIAILICLSLVGAFLPIGATEAQAAGKITVKSSGINNGTIDKAYGAKGTAKKNGIPTKSIPIKVTKAPSGTKYYAIYMYDPDGGNWTHWLAANYKSKTFAANASKAKKKNMVQGKNDFGTTGYGGPTPPSGTHKYVIKVYALKGKVSLNNGFTLAQFKSAVKGKTLATTTIKGNYSA